MFSTKDQHRHRISFRFLLSNRRFHSILFILIVFFIFLHLFQTSKFLIGHFFHNAETRRRLELDKIVWNENHRSEEKISRHIHQIWITSKKETFLPEKYRRAGRACQRLHPHYNYSLWTHTKISQWLDEFYPWFRPIYSSYSYDMQRVDAMKYLLLFHYGGVYIDLDVQCKTGDFIEEMLPKNETNDIEPDMILHMGTEGISANTDVMASKRFHPCLKLAVERLKLANRWFYIYHLTIILSAGPTYFFGIYRQCPWKDRVYFVSNDLLWSKLAEGVGGATWYGKDTLLIVFIVKNRMIVVPLVLLVIVWIFSIWKKPQFYQRLCRRINSLKSVV